MPKVISASSDSEQPQRDGRYWVHFTYELDDGTTEESSVLVDPAITTPGKLRNTKAKEIEARLTAEPPDEFLAKLDDARAIYLAGDRTGAEASLADAMETQR